MQGETQQQRHTAVLCGMSQKVHRTEIYVSLHRSEIIRKHPGGLGPLVILIQDHDISWNF